MSALPAEKKRWTVEEYLAMESASLDKHELFGGEIFLMAGASPEHNLIVSDLGYALLGTMRGKCQVYASDMRLFIPATGLYTYADTTVVCGTADLTSDNPSILERDAGRIARAERGPGYAEAATSGAGFDVTRAADARPRSARTSPHNITAVRTPSARTMRGF